MVVFEKSYRDSSLYNFSILRLPLFLFLFVSAKLDKRKGKQKQIQRQLHFLPLPLSLSIYLVKQQQECQRKAKNERRAKKRRAADETKRASCPLRPAISGRCNSIWKSESGVQVSSVRFLQYFSLSEVEAELLRVAQRALMLELTQIPSQHWGFGYWLRSCLAPLDSAGSNLNLIGQAEQPKFAWQQEQQPSLV